MDLLLDVRALLMVERGKGRDGTGGNLRLGGVVGRHDRVHGLVWSLVGRKTVGTTAGPAFANVVESVASTFLVMDSNNIERRRKRERCVVVSVDPMSKRAVPLELYLAIFEEVDRRQLVYVMVHHFKFRRIESIRTKVLIQRFIPNPIQDILEAVWGESWHTVVVDGKVRVRFRLRCWWHRVADFGRGTVIVRTAGRFWDERLGRWVELGGSADKIRKALGQVKLHGRFWACWRLFSSARRWWLEFLWVDLIKSRNSRSAQRACAHTRMSESRLY
jgi:hypothetical protein